jgi:hypothetical protein
MNYRRLQKWLMASFINLIKMRQCIGIPNPLQDQVALNLKKHTLLDIASRHTVMEWTFIIAVTTG